MWCITRRVHFMSVILWAVLFSIGCSGVATPTPAISTVKAQHVRFLHVADMHAQLEEHWEFFPEHPEHLRRMGGFARIKTVLEQKRREGPGAVFTMDGGDTFQGSALAAWTQGAAVLPPLNALGIDVGVPGNWDVVYGPAVFRKLYADVNFNVVCYNFHETGSGERLFPPAVVPERAGVRVAFIGVTDPTTTVRQPPAEVTGLDSTRLEGLRRFVQDLRERERPDLVVLVDHIGLAPSVQLAHDIPEFDLVFSGHTHERVYEPIHVGRTIVVEPGSMGSFLGQLDVTLQEGRITASHFELVEIDATRFPEDAQVKELIKTATAPFESRLREVVGETRTTVRRYDVLDASMDNLIADAVREATATEIAFTNGFRFSPPIPPGPITEADLWNMLPLDARVKIGRVTGMQLGEYLEQEMELVFARDPFALSGGWGPRPSGLEMQFVAKARKGERVQNVRIHGSPLEAERSYTIGGCERDGETMDIICRLQGAQDPRYVPGTIHSVLKAYLKRHSPLSLGPAQRVQALDLPAPLWSQYGTLQKMWSIPGSASAVEVPGLSSTKPQKH